MEQRTDCINKEQTAQRIALDKEIKTKVKQDKLKYRLDKLV